MLATLLPGIRHVRTPLVAGAMWMLVIWLWFGEGKLLRGQSRSTAETRLHDIAELVGPGVTLAAVSFVALLLGGLLPTPRFLLPRVNKALIRISEVRYAPETTLVPYIADLTLAVYGRVRWIDLARGADVPTFVQRWAGDVVDHLALRDTDELWSLHNRAHPAKERSYDPVPFDDLRAVISDGIEGETEQMTVQLQLERESIYNEVDRLRAEADLRLAIFFPCVALCVVSAVLSSWWVLLGIAVPILLLVQAAISENGAKTRVATAIAHGTVSSSVASFFRRFASLEQWPPLGPGNDQVEEEDAAATGAAWDELLVAVSAMQTFRPASGNEDARPLWAALRSRATLLVDQMDSVTFASWLAAELQYGSFLMADAAQRGADAKNESGSWQADGLIKIDEASQIWAKGLTHNLHRFRFGLDHEALVQLTDAALDEAATIAVRTSWDPPATEFPDRGALDGQD